MSKKKNLGQYFTPTLIAQSLVEQFTLPIKQVLELGAGEGSLGKALIHSHPNATYIGVEKDPETAQKCQNSLIDQKIITADVLNESHEAWLNDIDTVDTILGNPPFIETNLTLNTSALLSRQFPGFKLRTKKARAELLFLAHSLNKLKLNGQASFILPEIFFTSEIYRDFRRSLLLNFSDISVLELPETIFQGIEVNTCILSFTKTKSKNSSVWLGKLDASGLITHRLKINVENAITRMDFNFHNLLSTKGFDPENNIVTLQSIGTMLKRGSGSKTAIKDKALHYFHTTSFPKSSQSIRLGNQRVDHFRYAEAGDILIPRVGSRCLEKQVLVESGQRTITDCIYQLKVPEQYIDQVLRTLDSDFGKAWRKHNAKGSCAKYLTNSSLLHMPLVN
ncbi:MAG: SAM-dependent DNA methyltransferase [Neptuniibacter sp.]